jgi:hypothetical protein
VESPRTARSVTAHPGQWSPRLAAGAMMLLSSALPLRSATLVLAFAIAFGPSLAIAQTDLDQPISKAGLIEALKIGSLSQQELVDSIKRRGVAFPLSPDAEKDLREAGAGDDLITALRNNYRGRAVEQRPAPVEPSGGKRPETPTVPPEPSSAGPSPRRVTSLKEVHAIYIERMPNSLDQYLRTELVKRFEGVFTVVLDRSAADAILTTDPPAGKSKLIGTVSLIDAGRTLVIWSGSADDRKLKFAHGGEKTVASRLADQLKKDLERESTEAPR